MDILAQTKIEYNQSARLWEVWPGDYAAARLAGQVIAYPAGKAGQRAAQLSALTANAPAVAAETDALIQAVTARGFPQAIDRILKAGFLVARGAVRSPRPLTGPYSFVGEAARVESDNEPGLFYAVVWSEGSASHGCEIGYSCECADCSNGVKLHVLPPGHPDRPATGAPYIPAFGYACKHALAACLAGKIAYDWPAEPIPFEGEPWPSQEEFESHFSTH